MTATCRARFHCQRASSTSHAATNITASASGSRAPIHCGRQRASATIAAVATSAARPSSTGSGSSCRSAPPTTVLIEAPLQASKVVQSRTRPGELRGERHRVDGDAGDPHLLGRRQPEREREAVQRTDPVRIARRDDRREAIGLLRDRQRERAPGLHLAAPEEPRLRAGRQPGDAPRDAAVVARGERDRHGDDDRAGGVGGRDGERVAVDRPVADGDRERAGVEQSSGWRRRTTDRES